MNVLWCSWKDIDHPQAGGAERVQHEICKRLAADGHDVLVLTSRYPDAPASDKNAPTSNTKDGYRIVRAGNRYSVYYHAFRYYKKHLKNWPDIVVEEVNTIPFFTQFYSKKPRFLLFHQLSRQIWYHEMPWPLSGIGYIAEALYLRLLSGNRVITVSNSTKLDLLRFGFAEPNIQIISEGVHITPMSPSALATSTKAGHPTLLSFGSVRSMKRTLHCVQAFTIAASKLPELRLVIAGSMSSSYAKKVLASIQHNPYKDRITTVTNVSHEQKLKLMRQAHLFLISSVKEGWGLTVSEAATQGTPAVAYNVDGLRDAVANGTAGYLCDPSPHAMAQKFIDVLDPKSKISQKTQATQSTHKNTLGTDYACMRQAAYDFAVKLTFERSYQDFTKALASGQKP